MTKVFLDGVWQDYDYNLLYTIRGYTATKSTTVAYYDDNIELLEAWTNSGYTWIEKDHQWYLNREVPYYINTNTNKDLYRIQEIKSYPSYTKEGEQYLVDGDHFTTVQELYNTQGITETESQIIIVYNDDMESLLAWYNSGNIWIDQDHQWYNVEETPYYLAEGRCIILYHKDQPAIFDLYKKSNVEYILKDNHFITVQDLHDNQGYTTTASTDVVVYNESLTQLEAWSNSGSIWIEQDHQWYPNNSAPYYVETNVNQYLYRINVLKSYRIYNKNGSQYLIDNNHFTTVQELHDTLGYTTTASTRVILYNDSVTLLEAWSNSGFTWVDTDHTWYPNNSVPYYVKQSGNKILYYINQLMTFDLFKKNNEEYILKDNYFVTPTYLHDTKGYTLTESEVWRTEEGVPWSWYNPDEALYWNDKTKEWVVEPPDSGQSLGKLAFTSSTFAIQSGPDAIAYVQELYPDIKVTFPNLYPDFDEP